MVVCQSKAYQSPAVRSKLRCFPAISQMSAGLAYLHARGIVHRDLKTSNILIFDAGANKVTLKISAQTAPRHQIIVWNLAQCIVQ